LKKDCAAIEKNIVELVVYSEGVITYTEAWQMSNNERETVIKVLTELHNKKSGKNQQEYL
jgi:hypothetical protein|tara:strand:+ start:185 stop:364 length:180 start_codon:yes stop_codon:yes gene_type:complete